MTLLQDFMYSSLLHVWWWRQQWSYVIDHHLIITFRDRM